MTPRQKEVMLLLMEGLRDRDIAEQLGVTERGIKYHVSNLLKLYKVKSRWDLRRKYGQKEKNT